MVATAFLVRSFHLEQIHTNMCEIKLKKQNAYGSWIFIGVIKNLKAKLGPSPMPSLRIILDSIISPDPVGDGFVLLLLLGKLLLNKEGLVRRLN